MLRNGTTEGKNPGAGTWGHVGFLSSGQQCPETAACFSLLLQDGCSDKLCFAEHLQCCFVAQR